MNTHSSKIIASALSLVSFSYSAWGARLMPSDLTYLGAFRVPQTSIYGYACNAGGGCDLAFRPNGDPSGPADGYPGSLFLSNQFAVGEIRIPIPLKQPSVGSLNAASEIQSTRDITGGRACKDGTGCDYLGGITFLLPRGTQTTEKLYWTTYIYYNTAGTDYKSIGWSDTNFAALNARGPWHVGPTFSSGGEAFHGQKYGDYIFPIDQGWADTYTNGRSLFVGRFREGGTYHGSSGPVLTAIAPWKDGNPPADGTNLGATPLMYFANNPSTSWNKFRILNDPDYTYYSAKDKWNGGAWVQRGSKKAIIIVGAHGTFSNSPPPAGCLQTETGNGCKSDPTGYGPHCYGFGYSDCPGSIATSGDKGIHSGPYKARFIFIDPDELALVAQGAKSPSDITAYAAYDPSVDYPYTDLTMGGRDNQLGGIAYDSANGILYMMQPMAYRPDGAGTTPYPVVHAYKVNVSTTEGLASPSNLRVTN